jgi:hypothetical protein
MGNPAFTRLRGCRRGQALVEFALATAVLMLIVVGIVEFSRHYYVRLSARHAVAEAARFAITGQTIEDPDSGTMMTRAQSIVHVIMRTAGTLPLEVEEIVLDPPDGGGPSDLVQIRASYRFYFATSPMVRSFAPASVGFTVATTVKNEPVFQEE